jgi:type IV secretory pathway VirD2 relaxase
VISRDYISRGLRSRAEELVAIELGPKPEHEIRNSLERKSRRNDGRGSTGRSDWRRKRPGISIFDPESRQRGS